VLPSTVLFETGKSSFNAVEAGPFLDRVAQLLTRKTAKRVSVEGHTDADGAAALNEALSLARAKAVAEALAVRGVTQADKTRARAAARPGRDRRHRGASDEDSMARTLAARRIAGHQGCAEAVTCVTTPGRPVAPRRHPPLTAASGRPR
jgi:hypothetical protein